MIYFVTENYLKERTPIGDNVDIKRVSPWVRTSADMRIKPLLGTYFYEDILAKYNAQNPNAKETELIVLIQNCISWYSASEAVYGTSRPITNKGLQKQDGENSQGVDMDEIAFGIDHYQQKATFYQNRIIKFLNKNKDEFPKFTSELNKDSDLYPGDCNDDETNFNDSFLFI